MKTKALKNMILLMLVLVFTLQTLNVFCADTYRHPAEFEKMESLIIVWNFRNWGYEANVEDYHPIFREIVREAQSEVTVYIVSNDGYEISQYLEENQVSLDHIVFLSVRAFPEKAWVRDFGPYFVDHEGDRIILDTGYLDTLDGDQPDPYRSANAFPLSFSGAVRDFIYEPVLLRLDGGNFLTNGDGLILTTENITHSNIQKRPFYSVDELKTLVNEKFGGELHVLKEGPALVSAHIDTATKFINPHTVFVGEGSAEDKRQYPGYQALEENVRQLSQIQYRGRPLNIVRIPLPHVPNSPVTTHPYINSLILNHKVLVPVFNIPEDEQVLAVYRDQMPGYEIIGIDCSRIINTGGAIHCLTKEIPAAINPGAPRTIGPVGKMSDIHPRFEWLTVPGIHNYRIEIRKGNQLVRSINVHTEEGEVASYQSQDDVYAGIYTWRVGSHCLNASESAIQWSNPVTFKVSLQANISPIKTTITSYKKNLNTSDRYVLPKKVELSDGLI